MKNYIITNGVDGNPMKISVPSNDKQYVYYIKLFNSNTYIKAIRSNGYWFGMWRWIHDEEIEDYVKYVPYELKRS